MTRLSVFGWEHAHWPRNRAESESSAACLRCQPFVTWHHWQLHVSQGTGQSSYLSSDKLDVQMRPSWARIVHSLRHSPPLSFTFQRFPMLRLRDNQVELFDAVRPIVMRHSGDGVGLGCQAIERC